MFTEVRLEELLQQEVESGKFRYESNKLMYAAISFISEGKEGLSDILTGMCNAIYRREHRQPSLNIRAKQLLLEFKGDDKLHLMKEFSVDTKAFIKYLCKDKEIVDVEKPSQKEVHQRYLRVFGGDTPFFAGNDELSNLMVNYQLQRYWSDQKAPEELCTLPPDVDRESKLEEDTRQEIHFRPKKS